jgi:hypothetical protein
MPGLTVLAAISPDNTPHGYNLTFAIPLAVFAVVAAALYLMFARPHHRIPARQGTPRARTAAPDPDAARAASVAGGLAVAPGGGSAESHLEPAGPTYAADPGAETPAGPAPDDVAPPSGEAPSPDTPEGSDGSGGGNADGGRNADGTPDGQ